MSKNHQKMTKNDEKTSKIVKKQQKMVIFETPKKRPFLALFFEGLKSDLKWQARVSSYKFREQENHWGGTHRVSGAKRGMRGFSDQVAERHPQAQTGTEWRRAPATRAAWLRRRSVNAARRKTFPAEEKFEEKLSRLIAEGRGDLMCRLERQAERHETQRSWIAHIKNYFWCDHESAHEVSLQKILWRCDVTSNSQRDSI